MRWLFILLIFIGCTDDMKLFQASLPNGNKNIIADFRTATFNIYNTFGSQQKKDAIERHVLRSNSDIVTFTETSLLDYTYVQSQYAQYGYTDFKITNTGGNFQLQIMSKYPITYTENVTGGGGFPALYCEININGKTIGILSVHTYPDCLTSPCRDQETDLIIEPNGWNRIVQMQSYIYFFNQRKVANSNLKGFILQGDFNEDPFWNSPDNYTVKETGGFSLPNTLSLPLNRGNLYPDTILADYNGVFNVVQPKDLGNSRYTIWILDPNIALTLLQQIDYIANSDLIQLIASEILSGDFDSNTSGMLKAGNPVTEVDSRLASDHKLVMADFKIN